MFYVKDYALKVNLRVVGQNARQRCPEKNSLEVQSVRRHLLQYFADKHRQMSKSALICYLSKTLNLAPPKLFKKFGRFISGDVISYVRVKCKKREVKYESVFSFRFLR